MDGEQEYWTWIYRLDQYLADKLEILEYDNRIKPREKDIIAAYTDWAVGLLSERFIDICQPIISDASAFEIMEDFMWEMMTYRKEYGFDKNNRKVISMCDVAIEMVEELGIEYFHQIHGEFIW